MGPKVVLSLLIVAVAVSGCWSAPDGPSNEASIKLDVGSTAPLLVGSHCGVQYTRIDGETWRTALRDDSGGNAPDGWPIQISGEATRTDARTVVFTSDDIPEALTFHLAPNARYMCA
jgi:hypothetical protein